ncbi:MAG: serine/threonine protein kinase [Deltaproteobacteria bacterium]|nr:serine/threonine protein kinase [Deltaproteobacteria bacterium]MDQ3295783.1 serine/threonine protein kinase [Myxococcota bacterium]
MSSEQGDLTVMAEVTVDDTGVGDRIDLPMASALGGRYKIARRIGKGGMGEVMGARDEQIQRDVAIKRMRKANPSERAIQRFMREASIQGRLEHPAIVPVHEIGRDPEGLPFFVMKKLSGTTLAKILERPGGDRGSFPLQRVLRAFAEVCLAIEFAHVRGIVHRDLKPDNIMLGDFGEVYVLDWGVAKVIGDEDDSDFADVGSGSGEHATAAGTAIGTPGYMAPEQVQGKADIDGRCDVYTLGCLLFEILAGEPLHPRGFDGLSSAVAGRDARPSVRAPSRDIPPELDELCVEATRRNRDERLPTARELGDRVQRYLDGDRDLALRVNLAQEHLDKAKAAFEAGDSDDQRATAMREAAAAMALAPTLPGPPELIGRLMLEPPKHTPRDVADAIAAAEVSTARATAQAGIWALVATLAFTPLMWWMAPPASANIAILTALLLVTLVVLMHANLAAIPRPGLVVIANTIVVAFVSVTFSPLLIAPGVAAVLAMAMVLTPKFSILGSAWTIGVLLIVAVLGPLALEHLGALTPTMSVDTNGVLFSAPGFGGYESATIVVGVLYVTGLIVGACAMGGTMRRRTREAHHHLQLQAWQLRQLVSQH